MDTAFFWAKVIPALNEGLRMSVLLIIPSAIFGFMFGVAIGIFRVFGSPFVQWLMNSYVAVVRGVPLLLQLYFLYYALPKWGILFTPYQAACIGFILCSSAYNSEYIRGALLSIRGGQVKAAEALGFTRWQTVCNVYVPQALRLALPGCGNEVIYLIKYSSLAYTLTFIELTGQAKEIANREFVYIEVYLAAGMYYLMLTTIATWLLRHLEERSRIPGFASQR